MLYKNKMINNSPSTILEPLLQNQLLQEALTQRQCENRQSCIRLTSNNQRYYTMNIFTGIGLLSILIQSANSFSLKVVSINFQRRSTLPVNICHKNNMPLKVIPGHSKNCQTNHYL